MSAVVPAAAAGTLFEQDDQETLDLLLSPESFNDTDHDNVVDEITSRLSATASLFRDDFKVSQAFWNNALKSAEELGFRVQASVAPTVSNPNNDSTSVSIPAAFETDSGKLHIQATSHLLRLSKLRAVQLTLCALRSLDTNMHSPNDDDDDDDPQETAHLQSLLGTRDLLVTVREYYYQQRMARLQVVTECLRIEQDEDAPFHQETIDAMDRLDDNYTLDGHKRGLFQSLLNIACAPYAPPTRDELLPTMKLYSKEPIDTTTVSASDEFVTDCFQASKVQTLHERVQAMEALLVLLYHRIDGGIHRIDFLIILLAFEACGTFFTSPQQNIKRLPYLAGLVTAECTSLCMTASSEMDGAIPLWIMQHPLLVGVVTCQGRAVQELQALVMLLNKYASHVSERKLRSITIRTNENTLTDAPESIALYSFALLLRLVDMNMPAARQQSNDASFDFEKFGMECAQTAVDDCGVFDYLHDTMEALVKTPIRDSFSSVSNVPYDWQFSKDSSPLVLEGPSEQEELNAANVAYSSMGLEVLSATIVAFQSTIRTGNCISLENVNMLCKLAATIYGNHPLLCKPFWKNLEVYTSQQTPLQDGRLTSKQALCYLVDAAHACAASALNAAALASMEDHPGLEEDMLSSLVPLLQLMSSLCSSSGMVESVLKLLPKGMIRIALLCCAPTSSVKDVTSFSKNAFQIVQAVQGLARVGRSSSCRILLRNALEEEGTDIMDGPRVLYRIVAAQPSTDIVSGTLRILGYFVESATGHELWVAKAAKYLGPAGLGENGLSTLLTGQSTSVALSALHVLNGLVGNMAAIAFCDSCETIDILDALCVVMKGVTSSCMLLTTLVSSDQNPELGGGTAYLVAHGVFRCSAMLFRNLRPIGFMHKSLRIKAAAQEVRVNHIQTLSTSTPVGQAVAFFASAPVSLSLAIVMEEMLRNANVMQIASDEYARETEPLDFGAWRSITDASREIQPAVETAKVRETGRNIVSNIHELGIDLQGFQSRGWTDDATAMEPILAASAALDLLRLWLVAIDDAATEQDDVADIQEMSPCRLIFSQLVKPPIVEGTRSLRQVWPTDELTLFDVLMRYLDGADEDVPSLLAADVLSLALVTSTKVDQSLCVHFTGNVVRCAPELSLVLKQAITDIDAIVSAPGEEGGELSFDQDIQIRKGLASLRLLSLCLESESRIVDAICGFQSSPLDRVVEILNSTSSLIRGGLTFEQLASNPVRTSLFRAASSSIHALLSLFKSSATMHASQNLSDVVTEIKRKIFGDLVTIIEFVGRALSTASTSTKPSLVHVVAVLTAAASDALEVLTIEMSKELNESQDSDKSAKKAVRGLKTKFPFLSDSFGKVDAVLAMAQSWSKLKSNVKSVQVSIDDPRSLLCSFPATYLSHLESHQPQENLCDIVAASTWGLSIFTTQEISKEILQHNNASFVLLSKQSSLVKSWGQMAIMSSLVQESDGELTADVLISTTQAVLASLARIATVAEEAQMLVPENFLPLDVGMIADLLAGLLVETSSRLSTVVSLSQDTVSNLVGMLGELNGVQEKLLSSTRINRPNHHMISLVFPSYLLRETNKIRDDTSLTCCALQKRLLSAAISFFTTMDRAPLLKLSPAEGNQQVEAALKFVETACKGLELAGSLSAFGHDNNTYSCLSRELLESSVSLLTVLLCRERGPRKTLTDESQFFANAAAVMKRSNVMHSLVAAVVAASNLAVVGCSKERAQMAPLRADEKQVQLVQSIFNFVRVVTEIGKKSDAMLSLLSSADISKMIVDNSLLVAANEVWVSNKNANNEMSTALRGYLPLNGKMPVDVPEGDHRTIVTGTFFSGRDDPVFLLWRTAVNIVEAIVHVYSRPRDTIDSTNRHFLETAIAFLRTYYTSLIACLDQCSKLSSGSQRISGTSSAAHTSHTVLTFNTLCETADILALVSSLCTGTHLHMFENACYDIYHGMIRACHTVLEGLGEFLSAAGTAKEIFAAMKDYDIQFQQDNASRDGFAFSEPQFEANPLLSAGIPNAKHEAIKHAHYANRCCALVTSEDYKGLPTASSSSGGSPFSTSSLERDSQLSLNSPFMLRMEYAAAGCVSIAIAVLSETHPASSCFVTFSPEEVRHRDMLSLLQKGMIISALPEGEVNCVCRFYRVEYVDTVRRKCLVRHLDKPSDQAEESIDVDRVNGIEDTSKRNPVLAFSAAPTSFAELESAVVLIENTASTGDIISILRWCYQCTSDTDSDTMKTIRKVLAESASALLSTEMSLHELQGTFSMTKRDELSKRVMSQLLLLFDDSNKAPRWSGQLKQTMSPSVWSSVQQQLEEELRMARNDRREKDIKQLKRAAAVNGHSPWFGNISRESVGVPQPLSGVNFASR